MKTLHLIKISVGPASLEELQTWQTETLCEKAAKGEKGELLHITRSMPKRGDEILDGGSIYWVIKGKIVGRNRILELRPVIYDGKPHCAIVHEPILVAVSPRPHRAFQGWRYFKDEDAPSDLSSGLDGAVEEMERDPSGFRFMR